MRALLFAAAAGCLILVSIPDSPAWAFDGQRKGFILGFGLGPVVHRGYDYEDDRSTGTDPGILTDLKIGYGFSERFLLYYSGKQTWIYYGSAVLLLMKPGVGLNYYFSPQSRSLFLTFGAGPMFYAIAGSGLYGAAVGGASSFLGLGYEFGKHWSVDLDFIGMLVPENDVVTGGLAVTINVLGY